MWKICRHYKGNYYLQLGSAVCAENLTLQTAYLSLVESNQLCWTRPTARFQESIGENGEKRFTENFQLTRVTLHHELSDKVLPFGFDAWGDGDSLAEFIRSYDKHPNMLRGQRFALLQLQGVPLATVNTIRFTPDIVGIAWLATDPNHRQQGHAALLLRSVMALLRFELPSIKFLLFSEINPDYYRQFGFEVVADPYQFHLPSIAMATTPQSLREKELKLLEEYF